MTDASKNWVLIYGRSLRIFILLLLVIKATSGLANTDHKVDPELMIDSGSQKKIFKRSALLKHPALTSVRIEKDASYPGRVMTYRAIPVVSLFEGVKFEPEAVVQFRCSDGFSAPISKDRLLGNHADRSRAFVAIEDPEAPWPSVKPGGPSAGPFYLVWSDPEKSQVQPEEWPFQLSAFEVRGALKSIYPEIFPDDHLASKHPVRRGMEVFVQNCFPCHTLNKAGSGHVGPDLNVPYSPVEYYKKSFLKRLIRNNQSVRYYPQGKMGLFPEDVVSDGDLNDLIQYLEHMARRKRS